MKNIALFMLMISCFAGICEGYMPMPPVHASHKGQDQQDHQQEDE